MGLEAPFFKSRTFFKGMTCSLLLSCANAPVAKSRGVGNVGGLEKSQKLIAGGGVEKMLIF